MWLKHLPDHNSEAFEKRSLDFSKAPETFWAKRESRTAKSQTSLLQTCNIHIFLNNMNRSSLHTRSFSQRIHFSVLRYRWTKNGSRMNGVPTFSLLSSSHTTPKEYLKTPGGFNLKTHQTFSVHTTPEEFENVTITRIILDLWLSKIRGGKSVYKPHTTHNSSIRSDEGLALETSAFESLYGG